MIFSLMNLPMRTRVVDRLIASPRYGERLTLDCQLDAARFADTHKGLTAA